MGLSGMFRYRLIALLTVVTMATAMMSTTMSDAVAEGVQQGPHHLLKCPEYVHPESFVRERQKLMQQRLFWEQMIGRQYSRSEFILARQVALITQALKFDRYFNVVLLLEPIFTEVYLNFNQYRYIQEVLWPSVTQESEKDLLKLRSAELLEKISDDLDQYKAIQTYLDSLVNNTSTDAQSLAMKEKVQKVFDKLSLEILLRDWKTPEGVPQSGQNIAFTLKKPGIQELSALIDSYPHLILRKLRRSRNLEIYTFLSRIYPSQSTANLLDQVATRIGVNSTYLKAFLGSFKTEMAIFMYYPEIQRLVVSASESAQKLLMLMAMNAGTEDDLLITFARRSDLRNLWNELKVAARNIEIAEETAGTRSSADSWLQEMNRAETIAQRMGSLSLESERSRSVIVNRFFEALVAGVGIYFGYKTYDHLKHPENHPARDSDTNSHQPKNKDKEKNKVKNKDKNKKDPESDQDSHLFKDEDLIDSLQKVIQNLKAAERDTLFTKP
jgi:hypothetical protein